MEAFTSKLREAAGIEVKAAAADWRDLLRALDGLDVARRADHRIVADVKAALALHGYAEHVPMAGLAAMIPVLGIQSGSAEALRWLGEPPRPARAPKPASAPVPPTDEPLVG